MNDQTKNPHNEYAIADTRYTEQGIAKIEEVGLLSKDNLGKIATISKALVETYQKERIWRTEVEMRFSVLNDTKFPTPGMKFLQARREQEVHFRELMYLATDYEEKQGEILELQGELEDLEKDQEMNPKLKEGKMRRVQAKIKRCEWHLIEMQKQGHHRVREVTTWEKIKEELLAEGNFDPDDYDGIQAEGYGIRWERELKAEQMSRSPDNDHAGILMGSLSALNKSKEKKP